MGGGAEDGHHELGHLVLNWWFSFIWGTVGGLVLVAWIVHWIQVGQFKVESWFN